VLPLRASATRCHHKDAASRILGIVLGTIASFGVALWIASLLYGTTATDPATFAGMILLLVAVEFLAGYFPARRASRINPMIVLRSN
jgi:ABC-type antimicrobial peptide transport system permease subunit